MVVDGRRENKSQLFTQPANFKPALTNKLCYIRKRDVLQSKQVPLAPISQRYHRSTRYLTATTARSNTHPNPFSTRPHSRKEHTDTPEPATAPQPYNRTDATLRRAAVGRLPVLSGEFVPRAASGPVAFTVTRLVTVFRVLPVYFVGTWYGSHQACQTAAARTRTERGFSCT